VTLDADFKRHVQKYGVDFIVVILGQLDPTLALLWGRFVASA
jgi:hypothetical protein